MGEALLIVFSVLHLLGLLAAVHAILKSSTPQGALAWSLALLAFPAVVLPFYLIFGSTHFEGYVNPLRAGSLLGSTAPIREILAGLSECRHQDQSLSVLEKLARTPFTHSNKVELLIDAPAHYRRMHQEIEQACEYLLVLFYKVQDDDSGRDLKRHLIQKARQGVRVYFVYDELGSPTIRGAFLDEMRQAGIQARAFRAARGLRHSLQWNFCNHRKIVVADGRVALVGGMNISDRHLGRDPRFGPWRDTHAVLEGPAVIGVQLAFCEDFYWASRGKLPTVSWTPHLAAPGNQVCTYLSSGPADSTQVGVMSYLECINSARRRLWLASPYFLPDSSLLKALKMADLRGVEVRILIPPARFEPSMRLAALSLIPELRETGIQFYEYPIYNHSKLMLVDDWLAWVGSSNLDSRSLFLNFEGNLIVADQAFAAQMEQMLASDFERSRPLSIDLLTRSGLATRLGIRLARLFVPLL
ncbi:cardiolipin synthase [bacterium CPR1]|nr:cardiolipin synthase [bacterium CPR1]